MQGVSGGQGIEAARNNEAEERRQGPRLDPEHLPYPVRTEEREAVKPSDEGPTRTKKPALVQGELPPFFSPLTSCAFSCSVGLSMMQRGTFAASQMLVQVLKRLGSAGADALKKSSGYMKEVEGNGVATCDYWGVCVPTPKHPHKCKQARNGQNIPTQSLKVRYVANECRYILSLNGRDLFSGSFFPLVSLPNPSSWRKAKEAAKCGRSEIFSWPLIL